MQLTVQSLGNDRHEIAVRGHRLIVDQPVQDGGEDSGPTPVELFVASLASCVGHYAKRALGSDSAGARVECTWTMSPTPPWRVDGIAIHVTVPADTSAARFAAVRRAVSHCTVHNSIVDAPDVRIDVDQSRDDTGDAVA